MSLLVQLLESATIGASTPTPATVTLATGVPGPAGPPGPSGVVTAEAPLAYDSETQALSIDLSAYLTVSAAAAGYYPLSGNPSGFLTSASLAGYATQSWVTSQGYLTSASLAGYATESWVNSQGFLTASALSPYLTSAAAAATYYPLTNPAGYITSAALSGYATESWVTSQGYLTSSALTPYLTSANAAAIYQTLAGMSAYLTTSAAASLYAPIAAAVPAGGTVNQVLTKTSGADYSVAWTTPASGSAVWGGITGTLSAQIDLNTALGLKAPLASPAFSGVPTAPTPSPGTDSTQIATTEWVKDLDYAPLNSPQFVGNPRGPTPSLSDNDTSLATTAYVKGQSYLTTTSAASLYQPLSGMSAYLTTASAASIYQPLSGMSAYLTISAAAATYQPIGSYITDAPSDGTPYVRLNGAWEALIIS